MFTKLFALLVVFSKQYVIKAQLYQVNDTCADFPVEQVNDVIKEFFKHVSTVSMFPMQTEWFTCIMHSLMLSDSISYTMYDSLEEHNQDWHLNINGVLLAAVQRANVSITDPFIGKYNFEKIAIMIFIGDVDSSLSSLRSANRLFFYSAVLIINQRNMKICAIDQYSKVNCLDEGDFDRLDDLIETLKQPPVLGNRPFKVTMFEEPPTETKTQKRKRLYSPIKMRFVDKPVLQIMGRMLNLTPVNIDNPHSYGYRLPNGTFVGALGDIEYERAELANYRIIHQPIGASNIRFLAPITTISYKFLVPKSYYPHENHIHIDALPPEFNSFYFSMLIWIPIGLKVLQWIRSKIVSQGQHGNISWMASVLATYAVMSNQAITIRDVSSIRIYWMSLIWFQLIVYSVFQGNMIKQVNSADNSRDIQTIKGLLQSSLNITLPATVADFFQFDQKNVEQYNLKNRTVVDDSAPDDLISSVITSRSTATLFPETIIDHILTNYVDEKTGQELLHVVPEVAYEFYVAMYVPANSLFVEPFNRITMQCIETGIVSYGKSYHSFTATLVRIKRLRYGNYPAKDKGNATIDFNVLKRLFNVMGELFGLAILVFIGECVLSWLLRKIDKPITAFKKTIFERRS